MPTFDSSDDDEPNNLNQAKNTMKSLFASDKQAKLSGDQSLQYDGGKSAKEAKQAAGSSAGNQVAKQGTAVAYKGQQQIGACGVVLMANTTNQHIIVIVDKERRVQTRVRVDAELQIIQNTSEGQYCTLYDPNIQDHWTLMFRSPRDCTEFVVAVLTLHHYKMLGEGPRQHFIDLVENMEGEKPRKGDNVTIAMKVWLLSKVGSTSAFTIGKDIEEILETAPRTLTLGNGKQMQGVEDSLVASNVGSKRLLFLAGKKTKCSRSLGNPEIGPQDTAVVMLTLISTSKGEGALPDLAGMDDIGMPGSGGGLGGPSKPSKPSRRSISPEPTLALEAPPAPAQPAPAPAPAAPAAADPTSQLMQTLLLQQLQMQNEQRSKPAEAAAPPPAEHSTSSVFVERSLDRIHQQLSELYSKIDRIEIEKKLVDNNANIERMVKKAVGKMPVSEVDIEDMSKDRDQLLAKIEQMKQREQDLTDKYHKALEQLGSHKEQTAALKTDLAIQQQAHEKALKEANDRKRLEGVDHEVKHRRELDRMKEETFKEAREIGFKDGYNAGKVDAMTIAGSATTEELRKMIDQKEMAIVDFQTKITQMDSAHYEERRNHGEQVNSLQSMINRLERREEQRKKDLMDTAHTTGKAMKRIMNSTYGSIEEQIYAMAQEKVNTEEVLQLILMTIKQESRQAIDDFKKEAAARASQPLGDYGDDDDVPLVEHGVSKQPPAPPVESQTATSLPPELLAGGGAPQPPPPPAQPSDAPGDFQFSTLPPEVLQSSAAPVPTSVVPAYSDPYQGAVPEAPLMTGATDSAAPDVLSSNIQPLGGSPTAATAGEGSSTSKLSAFLQGSVDPPAASNIPTVGHTSEPPNMDWMNQTDEVPISIPLDPPAIEPEPPVIPSATAIANGNIDALPPPPNTFGDAPDIDLDLVVEEDTTAFAASSPPAASNGYASFDNVAAPALDEEVEPPLTSYAKPVATAAQDEGDDGDEDIPLDDSSSEEEFARRPPTKSSTKKPMPKPKQRAGTFLTDSDEDD